MSGIAAVLDDPWAMFRLNPIMVDVAGNPINVGGAEFVVEPSQLYISYCSFNYCNARLDLRVIDAKTGAAVAVIEYVMKAPWRNGFSGQFRTMMDALGEEVQGAYERVRDDSDLKAALLRVREIAEMGYKLDASGGGIVAQHKTVEANTKSEVVSLLRLANEFRYELRDGHFIRAYLSVPRPASGGKEYALYLSATNVGLFTGLVRVIRERLLRPGLKEELNPGILAYGVRMSSGTLSAPYAWAAEALRVVKEVVDKEEANEAAGARQRLA